MYVRIVVHHEEGDHEGILTGCWVYPTTLPRECPFYLAAAPGTAFALRAAQMEGFMDQEQIPDLEPALWEGLDLWLPEWEET